MGPRGSSIVCVAIAAVCVLVLLEDPPPPTAMGLTVRRGEEVFQKEAMCLACHVLNGQGGQNGPPLDHVATKWIRLRGGRDEARMFFHDHLVDPVKNRVSTWGVCPPQVVSYRSLGEDKIADICEYLLTLE